MAKPKWYGVATKYGYLVCSDWAEVERYLHIHSGSEKHRKFDNEEGAENFGKTEWKILAGVAPYTSVTGTAEETPAEYAGEGVSARAECRPGESGATQDDEPPW